MITSLKKYWLIWLINIGCVIALFIVPGEVKPASIIYLAVCEVIFIIAMMRSGRSNASRPVAEQDGKIIIQGVNRRMEIEKAQLERFEIKTNFLCTVFDWSLVRVTVNGQEYRIYTRRVKNPGVSFK